MLPIVLWGLQPSRWLALAAGVGVAVTGAVYCWRPSEFGPLMVADSRGWPLMAAAVVSVVVALYGVWRFRQTPDPPVAAVLAWILVTPIVVTVALVSWQAGALRLGSLGYLALAQGLTVYALQAHGWPSTPPDTVERI